MNGPLLPIFPPTKQQAISIACNLTHQLMIGKNLKAPIGKYAMEICKIFEIVLLPGEDPIKVAFDKLIEWRHAISFNIIRPIAFEPIIPLLIAVYGTEEDLGIRGAIASEVQTRNDRKAANKSRKPKEKYRQRQATAAPLYMPDNPYQED